MGTQVVATEFIAYVRLKEAMAAGRRADIASLATRAMITGLMALWLMAATAGLFIG